MNIKDEIYNLSTFSVFKITAGGSNGSIFIMYLKKGELSRSISIYCAWRLSINDLVLTGNHESSKSRIPKYLKLLKGSEIISIEFNNFFDLKMKFSTGHQIDIFCNITAYYPSKDYDENWDFAIDEKNIVYVVNNHLQLTNAPLHRE